jgi:hypothetical protein
MTEEGISLGWNCKSATEGVQRGLRNTRENGYKTCPFDEMITNYEGIIECIKDDFKYFCDLDYIELIQIPKESRWLNTDGTGDFMIYNKKYHFLFNHESPGHDNLFVRQGWENGMNHYILDNYKEFINRYTRRIQNFRDLIQSGKFIHFILTRPYSINNDVSKLEETIKLMYPSIDFTILLLDDDKNIFYDHLLLMKIDKNEEELQRLCV